MNLENTEISLLASAISSQHTDVFPNRLMAFINEIVPVNITLVVGFSAQAAPIELFRDFDAHSEQQYLRLYASGAYLLDPFYKISVDGTPSGLYPLRDVAPDRFFKSEYYFAYYRKLPLVDEICLTHRVSQSWCLTTRWGAHRIRGSSRPAKSGGCRRLNRFFVL